MAAAILGLDVGGANLKAATPDKRAVSVPFPLWKQPDKLPAALAGLVAKFPDAEELAVTMTGELCDCFETKREGVHTIIRAVRFASGGRPVRVWSTDGVFVNSEEAKASHMKVAAANWHALATFAGQYVPEGRAILVDVGSTTTDVIPILDGKPVPEENTDHGRLRTSELVYTGARRTPVCAVLASGVIRKGNYAAELFATTLDAHLILGRLPEDVTDCDTADGRAATKPLAHARLARMLGGDAEVITREATEELARRVFALQTLQVHSGLERVRDRIAELPTADQGEPGDAHTRVLITLNPELRRFVRAKHVRLLVSGSGEFLARAVAEAPPGPVEPPLSLSSQLGPEVSACAPAYAVAVLAAEARP